MSTLNRTVITERLSAYRLLRQRQSRIELSAFFVLMAMLLVLAWIARTMLWTQTARVMTITAVVILLLVLAALSGRRVGKAQRAAGLVCPACDHLLSERDLLDSALSGNCKHCGARIYHDGK